MTAIPLSIGDKAFNKELSVAENLAALAAHGFTHIHFSHGWRDDEPLDEATVTRWEAALAAAGLAVLDVHGPRAAIHQQEAAGRRRALELLRRRLELTARLGGDAMVYHVPTREEPSPEVVGRFLEGLAALKEAAHGLGVTIALENHFQPEMDRVALPAAFDAFPADYITFTLDPGHGNRSGTLPWLLEHACHRLNILHLNDNDGEKDRHWLPRSPGGTIDWATVTAVIAASPYAKPLQLEVRWHAERHPEHAGFLARAHAVARELHQTVARRQNQTAAG